MFSKVTSRRRLGEAGLRSVPFRAIGLSGEVIRGLLEEEGQRVRSHPSSAEGETFVDAALADLTEDARHFGMMVDESRKRR
jgi:hypothetical protein